MRASRMLRMLREGKTVFSAKLNVADPRVVEIAGLAGFDAVWTCMEHVPNTLADVENQIRAGKNFDMDVIVRVPRGSYSDLIRPLEMDAAGIMVPHVMDEDDARRIVQQARFYPIGLRALDGGGADGGYCDTPLIDYMHQANTQRLVIAQIEDPSALEQADRIAGVPGIDMLFFGPGDYSQALGIPGRFDDARIEAARRRVAEAAHRAGVFAGIPAAPADVPHLVDLGYRYFNVAADVIGLRDYFRERLSEARRQAPTVGRGDSTTRQTRDGLLIAAKAAPVVAGARPVG